MKITDEIKNTVTTNTYDFTHEGKNYIYIDYLNDSGKVIDSILRDEEGNDIDDPILFEEVQNFIDTTSGV